MVKLRALHIYLGDTERRRGWSFPLPVFWPPISERARPLVIGELPARHQLRSSCIRCSFTLTSPSRSRSGGRAVAELSAQGVTGGHLPLFAPSTLRVRHLYTLRRKFAKDGGVRVYIQSCDLIYATQGLLGMHAGEGGTKRTRLPSGCDLCDLVT